MNNRHSYDNHPLITLLHASPLGEDLEEVFRVDQSVTKGSTTTSPPFGSHQHRKSLETAAPVPVGNIVEADRSILLNSLKRCSRKCKVVLDAATIGSIRNVGKQRTRILHITCAMKGNAFLLEPESVHVGSNAEDHATMSRRPMVHEVSADELVGAIEVENLLAVVLRCGVTKPVTQAARALADKGLPYALLCDGSYAVDKFLLEFYSSVISGMPISEAYEQHWVVHDSRSEPGGLVLVEGHGKYKDESHTRLPLLPEGRWVDFSPVRNLTNLRWYQSQPLVVDFKPFATIVTALAAPDNREAESEGRAILVHGGRWSGRSALVTAVGHHCRERNLYADGVYLVKCESVHNFQQLRFRLARALDLSAAAHDDREIIGFLKGAHLLLILDDIDAAVLNHSSFIAELSALLAFPKAHLHIVLVTSTETAEKIPSLVPEGKFNTMVTVPMAGPSKQAFKTQMSLMAAEMGPVVKSRYFACDSQPTVATSVATLCDRCVPTAGLFLGLLHHQSMSEISKASQSRKGAAAIPYLAPLLVKNVARNFSETEILLLSMLTVLPKGVTAKALNWLWGKQWEAPMANLVTMGTVVNHSSAYFQIMAHLCPIVEEHLEPDDRVEVCQRVIAYYETLTVDMYNMIGTTHTSVAQALLEREFGNIEWLLQPSFLPKFLFHSNSKGPSLLARMVYYFCDCLNLMCCTIDTLRIVSLIQPAVDAAGRPADLLAIKLVQASAQIGSGKVEEATATLESMPHVPDWAPAEAHIRRIRTELDLRLGNFSEAGVSIRGMLKLFPPSRQASQGAVAASEDLEALENTDTKEAGRMTWSDPTDDMIHLRATALYFAGLSKFCDNDFSSARNYFEDALIFFDSCDDSIARAHALWLVSETRTRLRENSDGLRSVDSACRAYKELNFTGGFINGLITQGVIRMRTRDYVGASNTLDACSNVCNEVFDRRRLAHTLHALGELKMRRTYNLEAVQDFTRASMLESEYDDESLKAEIYSSLGIANISLGRLDHAKTALMKATELCGKTNNNLSLADVQVAMSIILAGEGQAKEGKDHLHSAIRTYRSCGNRPSQALSLLRLGRLYNSMEENEKAIPVLESAMTLFHDCQMKVGVADCLKVLGDVKAQSSDPSVKQRGLAHLESAVEAYANEMLWISLAEATRSVVLTTDPDRRERNSLSTTPIRFEDDPDWRPPAWQPDKDATACPLCSTEFTFVRRRHHCRQCSRVVCGDCSAHRIVLPASFGYKNHPVRVCDECFSHSDQDGSPPKGRKLKRTKKKNKVIYEQHHFMAASDRRSPQFNSPSSSGCSPGLASVGEESIRMSPLSLGKKALRPSFEEVATSPPVRLPGKMKVVSLDSQDLDKEVQALSRDSQSSGRASPLENSPRSKGKSPLFFIPIAKKAGKGEKGKSKERSKASEDKMTLHSD